jgi:hypothetical protein
MRGNRGSKQTTLGYIVIDDMTGLPQVLHYPEGGSKHGELIGSFALAEKFSTPLSAQRAINRTPRSAGGDLSIVRVIG